jgi:hypothetical protein
MINTEYGANMRINEVNELQNKVNKVKKFASWAIDQLDIKGTPDIEYGTDMSRVLKQRSFGSTNSAGKIWTHCSNRNAADAMRTLCHELVHFKQFEDGTATNDMDDEQRLAVEDEANAIAGRLMREYGKLDKTIYEGQWKFAKSRLTEDEFAIAYGKNQKKNRAQNPLIKFMPPPMFASGLRRLNEHLMEEHPDIIDLRKYQQFMSTQDGRLQVSMRIGSEVAVLQFEPHIQTNVIDVKGFTTPKKIASIHYQLEGLIDWIEFSDGTMYPDSEFVHHNKGGGEYDGLLTLFFATEPSAEHALMLALLNEPKNWTVSAINIKS